MTDFLLELRSEEIPARMQVKAKDDLARLFAEEIAKAGLVAESIETFATPRRLALIARGLPDATQAVREETKGPKIGAPPQALDGFLRKSGLTQDQLTTRDGVYFAVVEKPGRATAQVLAEAIPAIVRAFPWPKSMRWGAASVSTESLRWVRPLQGIVALFGEDIVAFDVDGIQAGAITLGHRFHHPGAFTIGGAHDYVEKLREAHVIVHLSERVALIREGAERAAAAAGLSLVEDEGLVLENAGLTEWPVPLLGRFDAAFLDVPREVIQLTMRTNQKYFACTDSAGELANAFVCTANIDASDGGAAIIAGNERVLSARLSDAKFFWDNDLKVPLEDQAAKLKGIVFHEKLGTVADKVERVAKLARWLVESGVVKFSPPAGGGGGEADGGGLSASAPTGALRASPPPEGEDLTTLAERAARLCKADLVTGMVGEFPELQGIIGGYLARAQGEAAQVADAIRDHYKPVGQGDDVPTDPVTVAVSLADKLDTIGCFFVGKMEPTGSRDPFALRRAALSIISLVCDNRLRLKLSEPLVTVMALMLGRLRAKGLLGAMIKADVGLKEINEAAGLDTKAVKDAYVEHLPVEAEGVYEKRISPALASLLDFLADRLKVQQREAGVRHDLIDAVFALGGEDDLVRLLARVKALQAFVATPEGADLLAGYKRAANILKKAGEIDPRAAAQGSMEPAESALLTAVDHVELRAATDIQTEDFEAAMTALASLRTPIDAFFADVMVHDPDPAKRAFRLGLLARFRDAVHRVADFSKIEG